MTETEWMNDTNFMAMLVYLRGEVEPPESEPDLRPQIFSGRKTLYSGDGTRVTAKRLSRFARECCKKWWDLPLDEASSRVVASYERFLTETGTWDEFAESVTRLQEIAKAGGQPILNCWPLEWSLTPYGMSRLTQTLAWITATYHNRATIEELERTATDDDRFAWGFFGYMFPEFNAIAATVFRPLPGLLREIVGNPFRATILDPSWLTSNVLTIVKAIDDQQAFDHMPILADALEEAGCDDADVLGHCRGGERHIRGCWLVDLLLGQE